MELTLIQATVQPAKAVEGSCKTPYSGPSPSLMRSIFESSSFCILKGTVTSRLSIKGVSRDGGTYLSAVPWLVVRMLKYSVVSSVSLVDIAMSRFTLVRQARRIPCSISSSSRKALSSSDGSSFSDRTFTLHLPHLPRPLHCPSRSTSVGCRASQIVSPWGTWNHLSSGRTCSHTS